MRSSLLYLFYSLFLTFSLSSFSPAFACPLSLLNICQSLSSSAGSDCNLIRSSYFCITSPALSPCSSNSTYASSYTSIRTQATNGVALCNTIVSTASSSTGSSDESLTREAAAFISTQGTILAGVLGGLIGFTVLICAVRYWMNHPKGIRLELIKKAQAEKAKLQKEMEEEKEREKQKLMEMAKASEAKAEEDEEEDDDDGEEEDDDDETDVEAGKAAPIKTDTPNPFK